jgi:hypothetical protein
VIDMIEQKPASLSVPVLLIALAVVVWSGFQASQLYQERASLSSLRTSQETTFSNAEKMRRQLDRWPPARKNWQAPATRTRRQW